MPAKTGMLVLSAIARNPAAVSSTQFATRTAPSRELGAKHSFLQFEHSMGNAAEESHFCLKRMPLELQWGQL
jgi:hypothetical protein